MTVTFEQARDILAEDLDAEGDGRTVAAWGWENDEVFVLAFDLPYESIPENVSDDPEREAALRSAADGADDSFQIPRGCPGWDYSEGCPQEVPVVDKATGELRWVIPSGESVVPNMRPIGEVPEPQPGPLWLMARRARLAAVDEATDGAPLTLTIRRDDLITAFGCFVYRTDDGRILTDDEAFDEVLPEIAKGLEGLPPEDQVIDGGDVEEYIRENAVFQTIDVDSARIVTQYSDGKVRWTNNQLQQQVFPTTDHGDMSFEDWLANQLEQGKLTKLEVLQYVGYEDEDADEETIITERLIID